MMSRRPATKDYLSTNPLYVILSEVELLRVERSEQAEARALGEAGSRLKSRWLAKGM